MMSSPKDESPASSGRQSPSNVASSAEEFAFSDVKHPLDSPWTLWYFKNDRSKSWEQNLKEVVTFDTVEDFWGVYNHIELVSRLGAGCDYSVFKKGIKPMWEDPRNERGGRWLINLDKKHRSVYLDKAWLEVLMCLIGESFEDDGPIVNGAVVQVRPRGDKIGIWLGNAKKEAGIMHVGKVLKQRLGLGNEIRLGFEAHEDTMHKSGSTIKNRYVL